MPIFARRAGADSSSSPAADDAPSAAAKKTRNDVATDIRSRLASRPSAPSWDSGAGSDDLYDSSPPPDWAEAPAPAADIDDEASEDDADLEHSGVFGRKAVEKILDGVLIEEQRLDSP